MNKPGLLVCFASPSGGGKTTLCHRLLEKHHDYKFSVSSTTRLPRDYETDGKDYHFVTHREFKQQIRDGELAEYEEVHGELYGTTHAAIQSALTEGKVLLVDIDVKGAMTLKDQYQDQCVTIFIQPPSLDVLKQRLIARGTEDEDSVQKRLHRLSLEMEYGKQFDFEVINDTINKTVSEIETIIEQHRTQLMEESDNVN